MKIAIILAFLYALYSISFSQDVLQETKKFVKDCLSATKANKADFEDFAAETLKPANVPMSMKCTMKCFMEKNGYFAVGSTILKPKAFIAKLRSHTAIEDLENGLELCMDLKGTTSCDTSFQIMTCMWNNNVMNRSRIVLTEKNELSS